MKNKKKNLAIIGLGYVGLPLAIEFAKKYKVTGFDLNKTRIKELKKNYDSTLEIKDNIISSLKKNLDFTSNIKDIKNCNIYIICVPTPIDEFNQPDLKPLISSSKIVVSIIKKKDIIIYESTVYPGVTEDICVKELEKSSGLKFNKDFFCGYSPERINPGDKVHTITKIKKITSGSTPEIANEVNKLYKSIITAGTYQATSIRVAEAAKVIENTQRDLNIALINELSILFSKMNIDTKAVLDAAGSKWNFLPFVPGLVGGHCIGVDPYYLTHKAKIIGYKPKIILAGRKINDKMGAHVAFEFVKRIKKKNIKIKGSKILVMGLTFKENCKDIRNSGIENVITELKKFDCRLDLYDPWVNSKDVKKIYSVYANSKLVKNTYDGIIIAVAHKKFKSMGLKFILSLCKKKHVIYDLKYLFSKDQVDLRL